MPAGKRTRRDRRHDSSYRLIFSHPETIRELLAGHCARWIAVGEVDFSTLVRLPDGYVTDEGTRRSADMAWIAGYGEDAHLVVLIEFRSSPDPEIAGRVAEYGGLAVDALAREGRVPEGARVYGLGVVIHNGLAAWSPPGSAGPEGPPPGPGGGTGRASRWSPFLFVDMRSLPESESTKNTLLAWMAGLERALKPEAALRLWARVDARYGGPEHESLRRHLWLWTREWAGEYELDPKLARRTTELDEEGPMVMAEAVQQKIQEWKDEARAEGVARGRAEGMARVLCRWADRRFGPGAAERLEALLRGRVDPTDGVALMDAVLDADTPAGMLARVDGVLDAGRAGRA